MHKTAKFYDAGVVVVLLLLLVLVMSQGGEFSEETPPPHTPAKVQIISKTIEAKWTHKGRWDYGYLVMVKVMNLGPRGPVKVKCRLWTKKGSWTKYKTIYLDHKETETVIISFFEPSPWQKARYYVWVERG